MKLYFSRNMIPALILLILVVLLELFGPKPIDWTPNFNKDDQRPFGDKILVELIEKDLFPQQEIETRSVPIYNYSADDSLNAGKNYIYITKSLTLAPWDGKRLLHMAEIGNQIFIAANFIGDYLADTLKLKIEDNLNWKNISGIKEQKQHFERSEFNNKQTYLYKKGHGRSRIIGFPKEEVVVLGRDNANNIQFIKIPFGKGNIFYHTQPLAFTNYNLLLNKNAELVYKAFSYLPQQTTIWDEYYKPLSEHANQSPLSYILSSPPIKLAYYLLIISLILFMYFNGKRQQRSIPIIKPLRNSSLDFIHTVGRLYYNRKNHKDIAQKKFLHLKEYLRSKYHIELHGEKEKYLHQLSLRSSISERTLILLFEQAELLFKKKQINDEDLENFHAKIEYIYENCQ